MIAEAMSQLSRDFSSASDSRDDAGSSGVVMDFTISRPVRNKQQQYTP